jgi:hypothetical protein
MMFESSEKKSWLLQKNLFESSKKIMAFTKELKVRKFYEYNEARSDLTSRRPFEK